eukprot:gnl/MRDRNA2_/MRDRNA2_59582_c0_seq1.p1 gnl/MRDRNA2_/MRDRNA2_59582_c0~~gnl/MRDRNA2_/MRDRNA2_59582_c0_seq1.p1  ORF type:complete len:2264 (-),score=319.83 gnl/MRDRNA2_/MRDRNA2_59582_c0_seq1:32-6823(-)
MTRVISVLWAALVLCQRVFQVDAKAWEGGAELYFDGIDDFLIIFPSFKLLSDWTIEAWIQPDTQRDRQCLMHLSTYSAVNLFALEASRDKWKIRYGEHQLLLNSSIVNPSAQQREFRYTNSQHHVAITHKMLPGDLAQLSFILNGTRAMTALLPLPEIPDPAVAFVFGACHEIAGSGILREHPFQGHVDELRHWTSVREVSEVQSLMRLSGPSTRWPTSVLLDGDGLSMQCQCSVGYTGSVVWDSKKNAHTGKCERVKCPGVSMPGPGSSCVCPPGYTGSYSWKSNEQQYSGSCKAVRCPQDPGIVSTPMGCSCRAGYIGKIIWDPLAAMRDEMWKGSCRLANCPPNSVMSYNRTSCICDVDSGWVGTLEWNFETQSYSNSCIKEGRGVATTPQPESSTLPNVDEAELLNTTTATTEMADLQTTSMMPLMAPEDGSHCHVCLLHYAGKGGCVGMRMEFSQDQLAPYMPPGCELCEKFAESWCMEYLAPPANDLVLPCLSGTLWRPLTAGAGAIAGACDAVACPAGAEPVYEMPQQNQVVTNKDGEITIASGQILAQVNSDSLEAQYNFDSMTDLIVYDSAIKEERRLQVKDDEIGISSSHDGMLGGGTARESPRYERSVFGDLEGGAQYFELRKQSTVKCPSVSCMEFDQLLKGTAGVNYNALLIKTVPKNKDHGIYLTLEGSSKPLEAMTITNQTTIVVHTESIVAFDTFEVQPCRGTKAEVPTLSRCHTEKVRKIVFKVLEHRAPIAGEAYSLQLLGSQGYLQMQEPLGESATIEFWVKMTHFDDNQALFSIADVQGKYMVHLGLFNSRFEFHSCSTQDAYDGIRPKTVFLDQLQTTEPQHLAVAWEYERTVRGKAVYRVSIYQNCKKLETIKVEDSCFRFGQDDASLHLPTFGQRYEAGSTGVVPSNFASAYFKDIRVWSRAVPQSEICNHTTTRLKGNEQGLQGYFPISIHDKKQVEAFASTLSNLALREGNVFGPALNLKCSKLCGFCPDFSRSVGYALRPSVFHLPPESVQLVTTAGRLDGYKTLPPLQLQLHMFDPDNYRPYKLEQQRLDDMFVRVVQVPNSTCGALFKNDQRTLINGTENENISRWELPLYFKPLYKQRVNFDSATCTTEMGFKVVDTSGLESPFSMKFELVVKVPGPQILEVLAIEPGLSDNTVDVGDMISIRFDRPTTRGPDYTKYLEVVHGSFGDTGIASSWNDVGDVLILEVTSKPQSLNIIPGTTFFKLRNDLGDPLYTANVDSYPSIATSDVVKGNFNTSFCSPGMVFIKGSSKCKACPEGSEYSEDGMSCIPCAPGTYARYTSSPKCRLCLPGTYLPAGSTDRSQCIEAVPGRYVDVAGSGEDYECPKGTVAEKHGAESCERCPEGADCETPEQFRTFKAPKDSYYRMPDGSIEKCKVPALCKGKNQCIPGHQGNMCYQCVEGQQTVRECDAFHLTCNEDNQNTVDVYFTRSFDKPRSFCRGCPSKVVNEFYVFLVPALTCFTIWVWGVLSYDAALFGNMHAVIFRIVLNYFTSLSVLARLERWEYEPLLGKDNSAAVDVALSTIFRFDGGFPAHLMELNCFFTQVAGLSHWESLQQQTILWLILPLVLPIGLLVLSVLLFECYTYHFLIQRCIRQEQYATKTIQNLESMHRNEFIKQGRFLFIFRTQAAQCPFLHRVVVIFKDCVPLMFICHFVIYPTVVRHLLIMLTCEQMGSNPETTGSVLLAVPDVECFKGEHMTWALASLAGLLVWGLGIPLALYFFLKANKAKMSISIRIRALTGFVADGYESDFFYWEAVVQLRRFAYLFIAVLPNMNRAGELALYQIISIGSIVLHLNAKPFDNRAGEMLDKIELYGLLNFFLLVSALQVIFLVDASSSMDMVPAFITGFLVFFSSFFVKRRFLGHGWFFKAVGLGYFAGVLIVYSLGSEGELRQLAAFLFFMMAATLNLYYVLWVALKSLLQIRKSAADAFIAKRRPPDAATEESGSGSPSRASARRSTAGQAAGRKTGVPGRGSRNTVVRGSTSMLDIALAKDQNSGAEGGGWLVKLQAFLARAESKSQGALIRYETSSNELILGLHPDTYMNDPHLSAYARRTLARSGPFLTDQEREYVSMALKDCLQHVIVGCSSDRVNCGLLEFLCRLAFTWKFRKQELSAQADDPEPSATQALAQQVGPKKGALSNAIMVQPSSKDEDPSKGGVTAVGGLVAKMAGAKWRKKAVHNLTKMMFDEATFEQGMTAADFQLELMQVLNISKRKFDELFKDFMVVKDEMAAQAEQEKH